MPRWEPHARQRLEAAALDLFASRGYDDTTVADIAERAGVTARTFHRHFADKREVLFGGADDLRDSIVAGLRRAPGDLGPLAACAWAMRGCEELFQQRGQADLRRRDAVVEASEELREREGRKLRSIAEVVATELQRRLVAPGEAVMVADVAGVVLVHASRHWTRDPDRGFAAAVDRALAAMERVVLRPPPDRRS